MHAGTGVLAGLLGLFSVLDVQAGSGSLACRLGAATTIGALALYGVVLAVDGVALKQAVDRVGQCSPGGEGGALRWRRNKTWLLGVAWRLPQSASGSPRR